MDDIEQETPNVFHRHSVIIFLLLLMLSWSLFYPIWRQGLLKLPVDSPISVSPPGRIQEQIYIPWEEEYQLLLGFDRSGRSSDQWRELLGDRRSQSTNVGVPISIQWELFDKANHSLVKSATVKTSKIEEWHSRYVFRLISYIKVPPGNYELVVKILQDVPELANTSPRIVMKLEAGKDAALTPQRALISWIGLLMIEPLMWIIEGILAVVLIVKIVRGR